MQLAASFVWMFATITSTVLLKRSNHRFMRSYIFREGIFIFLIVLNFVTIFVVPCKLQAQREILIEAVGISTAKGRGRVPAEIKEHFLFRFIE